MRKGGFFGEGLSNNMGGELTSNPFDLAQTPPSCPAMAARDTQAEASSWLST